MKFLGLIVVSVCLAAIVNGQSGFSNTVGQGVQQSLQNALGTSGIGQNVLGSAGNAITGAVNAASSQINSWNIPSNSQINSAGTGAGIFQQTAQGLPGTTFFDNGLAAGTQQQLLFNSAGATQGLNGLGGFANTAAPIFNQGVVGASSFNPGVPFVGNQVPMGGDLFLNTAPGILGNQGFASNQAFNTMPTLSSNQVFNTIPTFSGNQGLNVMPGFSGSQVFNTIPTQNFNTVPIFSAPQAINTVPFSPTMPLFNSAQPMYDAIQGDMFGSPVYNQAPYMGFSDAPMYDFANQFNSMAATSNSQLRPGETVVCFPANAVPQGLGLQQGKK